LREKYPGLHTTTNLEDIIADPQINAVVVATPAESHRQVAVACLLAGKNVFVEKTLASNSNDAENSRWRCQENA